jgi:hypothetical protein
MTDPSSSGNPHTLPSGIPAVSGAATYLKPYQRSREIGGSDGAPFADDLTVIGLLVGFRVYADFVVLGLQALWVFADGEGAEGKLHGTAGGDRDEVWLQRDEYLIGAEIATEKGFITSLAFLSNQHRRYGPYGRGSEPETFYTEPIQGFFGRGDALPNALGVYSRPFQDNPNLPSYFPPYVQRQQYGGGTGGEAFSDDLTEITRVKEVRIRSGAYIDSIQLVWELADGSTVEGEHHGGQGGTPSSFTLAAGEFINRIHVGAGAQVDSLTFYTNRGETHGPFGNAKGGQNQISGGPINGFHGRSGVIVYSIGAFSPIYPETSATADPAA